MATPPQYEGAQVEHYSDSPEWFKRYLKETQPFFADTTSALTGALSRENLRLFEETRVIEIPTPTLTLQSGWSVYGDARYDVTPYIYREGRRVFFTGIITSASAPPTDAVLIPSGYRPLRWQLFPPSNSGASLFQYNGGSFMIEHVSGSGAGATGMMWSWETFEIRPPFPMYLAPGFQPRHVLATQVHNRNNQGTPGSACFVDWDWTSDGRVKIKDIPGLREGNSYSVTFLAL